MIFGGNFKLNYLGIVLLIKVHLFKNEVAFIVSTLIIHIIHFLNKKLS
jgi:hypothetical protein